MGREGFNKFIGLIFLLIVFTLLKRWFDYSYVLVWLGVIIGFYFPFLDHLFYAYIVRPDEEISKNIRSMITFKTFFSLRRIRALVDYIHVTANQRRRLILHTAYFQVLLLLLTFLILSSNSNLFGRGLVFGFSAKLLLEEVLEFIKSGKIDTWFSQIPLSLDSYRQKIYLYVNGLALLIFSLML